MKFILRNLRKKSHLLKRNQIFPRFSELIISKSLVFRQYFNQGTKSFYQLKNIRKSRLENQILRVDRANFLPNAPNIDGGPVMLFSEQQLRRSVPQRDDSICIGPLLVGVKSTRQPKVRDFQFAPERNVI